ncbi:hypothetical protein [Streptomyces himastatinicus]|uniref:hypothetical protein n=1 Tax=Streptomyces himastatinicus TaxID=998084 RepID=UPI0002E6839B|nr:hypothetical protein [Streptomyces himastatinicus]
MEQRIGPIIPPVPAAGTDPGHIPGLTPPRPDETEEVTAEAKTATEAPEEAPEKAADQPVDEAAEAAEAEADTEEAEAEADKPEKQAEDADEAEDKDEAEAEADAEAEPEDGPVFEVSDRRGSITAGHSGVAFQLDGENAEFSWDEIGAVEIDTPRFGRRFSVTVYTTAQRWYAADVDAPARGALKEWTTKLDEVLDAYFEDASS